MKKTLIIYSSHYGYTKIYAEWIAEELKGDIHELKNIRGDLLTDYDIIILGSGLYAGRISGINLLVNNYEKIKRKKIIIFTCGLADISKTENINAIKFRLKKVVPKNILENINIFFLRGGINYSKLSIIHKIMMWMMKNIIIKKGLDKLNEEDKEFFDTYGKAIDFMDKNNIKEIIEYCKN